MKIDVWDYGHGFKGEAVQAGVAPAVVVPVMVVVPLIVMTVMVVARRGSQSPLGSPTAPRVQGYSPCGAVSKPGASPCFRAPGKLRSIVAPCGNSGSTIPGVTRRARGDHQ